MGFKEWLDLAPLISIAISLVALAVTTTGLLVIPMRQTRGKHSTGKHYREKSRAIARRQRRKRRKAIRDRERVHRSLQRMNRRNRKIRRKRG